MRLIRYLGVRSHADNLIDAVRVLGHLCEQCMTTGPTTLDGGVLQVGVVGHRVPATSRRATRSFSEDRCARLTEPVAGWHLCKRRLQT
jgi:hypothetical protein